MNDERGGDSERIAPIIPLFGGSPNASASSAAEHDGEGRRSLDVPPRRDEASGAWRSTWDEPAAAVARGVESSAGGPSERHPARRGPDERGKIAPRLRALNAVQPDAGVEGDGPSADELRRTAEDVLVRKLRGRSLSVSEARLVLKGSGLDSDVIDDVIDDFSRRGYLDDAVLAELLVTSGVERKGQGRVALSRSLAQRGIPRDVVDAALDELPDDDAERALAYARTKARSMGRLDPDAALRRLTGQLARRGYNGAVAMNAAKTALREATFGGSTSGVRFVDSD